MDFDFEILVKKLIIDEIPEIDVGESMLSFRVWFLLAYYLLLGGDLGGEAFRKFIGKLAFLMLKSCFISRIGYLSLSFRILY